MTPRMLSITDRQLAVIHEAAKLVMPDWRSRFLEAITDRLLAVEQITDCAVSEAVNHVLAQMHINVSCPQCAGDRA